MKTPSHSRILTTAAIILVGALLCGTSFAQYTQTILHTFTSSKDGSSIGRNPLFVDPSGSLYGTSFSGGGANAEGTFFTLTPASGHTWHETQLYTFPFSSGAADAISSPSGAIVRDAAGNFYGLSPYDGPNDNCYYEGYPGPCGTVWELSHTSQGWQRKIIYRFTGGSDGGGPASLIIDASGNLYGVTNIQQWGTVFELSPSGSSWRFKTLYTFSGGADGGAPNAIVLDRSGNLIGSTYAGGIVNSNVCSDYDTNNNGCGVIFELSPASGGTWNESTLYSFLGTADGGQPFGTVALDPSGNLFGIALDGGANSAGVIFKVSESSGTWAESAPYSFTFQAGPSHGLTSDAAGNIYGSTQSGGSPCDCGTLFELSLSSGGAYTYNTLYSFTGAFDGSNPSLPPTIDHNGNLFVPSNSTFASNFGGEFLNIEFELSPASAGTWRGSVVHDFPGSNDGWNPVSSLIRDSAGNLYGTTPAGGLYGWGAVFEITPSGSTSATKLLYSFHGTSDGAMPRTSLAFDSAGNLYGTAQFGGSQNCLAGCGTVFKLSPSSGGDWNFSVLHTFLNLKDGSGPTSGVTLDASGNIYGTSQYGNNGGCFGPGHGCGTVFKLAPTSHGEWNYSLLHAFSGSSKEGGVPDVGGLVMDSSGNLYGATGDGGGYTRGNIYELSPQFGGPWKQTVLYNFSQAESGSQGTLAFDKAGNLYGTTNGGGTYGYGTAFELSQSGGVWTKTTLFSFNGSTTGGNDDGGVIFDSLGNLYGVNNAIAFELSPVAGSWQETTLYSFGFLTSPPYLSLVIDPSGNLYGVIAANNGPVQNVVYELTP
ncbi:MAG: choice-of-anchor tandem repeat GloVer-containing protein [Candidatus Sulfotelmatobacter sp.]